jgi:hypothetical protein
MLVGVVNVTPIGSYSEVCEARCESTRLFCPKPREVVSNLYINISEWRRLYLLAYIPKFCYPFAH